MGRFPRMKGITWMPALFTLALSGPAAQAATVNLFAALDGPQTNSTLPGGGFSPGTGTATVTFDTDTNVMTWDVSVSGLVGNTTVAHFHGPAAPGQNAGVRVLAPSLPLGTLAGSTSGSFSGSQDLDDLAGASVEAWQAELLGGLWYLNVHTTSIGSGEIRGQVQVVPLPAAAWFLATALVALGAARRRGGLAMGS